MQLQSTTAGLGSIILIFSMCAGCGVSKEYIGANARTIRTNSEQTSKTLAATPCDQTGNCSLKQGVIQIMSDDLKQITERANAMCAISEPHCDGAQAK